MAGAPGLPRLTDGVLGNLAPARRRLVLALLALVGVVVGVGVLLTVAAVLRSAGVLGSPAEVADPSRPGPVLLVPGYGGSEGGLRVLASALREQGRDVTVVRLPDRARGDLGDQADALGDAVDTALDRTGQTSVDLVGYSAGGVVARLWVTREGPARVRRLVTLASPHHGTQLAAIGTLFSGACPTACQQLVTDSPVLDQLAAEGLPVGPGYLSLWTTADDVVVPPTSAVLEGVASPSVQSVCAGDPVRHSGFPSDPVVVAMVGEALGVGPVPSWTTADCERLSS